MLRVIVVVSVLVGTARAEPSSGGYLGIGVGPRPAVGGELGALFTGHDAWDGGRIRLGGRLGHVGLELAININALSRDGMPTGSMLWTPAIVGYAIAHPRLQLAARAGLGGGKLSSETTDAWGFGLDLGVTAQAHLTPTRRAPMLWIDAGVQLLRHHLDDRWIDGRIFQLTVGVAYAIDH